MRHIDQMMLRSAMGVIMGLALLTAPAQGQVSFTDSALHTEGATTDGAMLSIESMQLAEVTSSPATPASANVPIATKTTPVGPSIAATSSDAYAAFDLLNRMLDVMLKAKRIDRPNIPAFEETQLGPLHVYQMALMCLNRTRLIAQQVGQVHHVPTIVASAQ